MEEKIALMKKVLQQENELEGWKIIVVESKKCNIYITKNSEKESNLQGERSHAEITIYKKFGKQLGDSSFTILLDEVNEAKIKKRIKEELSLRLFAKKILSTSRKTKMANRV